MGEIRSGWPWMTVEAVSAAPRAQTSRFFAPVVHVGLAEIFKNRLGKPFLTVAARSL